MAFVDTILATKDDLPKPVKIATGDSNFNWYNLDQKVGPQRFVTYRKDDVQLVQLFIYWIAKNPMWKYVGFPEPNDELEVDGVFGKTTKAWIEWFQGSRDLTKPYGAVSRAKSGQTAEKKYYTIVKLNEEFAWQDAYWHENLATDGRTPPELRDALQRSSPWSSWR